MNETYQSQSSLLIDEPPMLMLPSLAKVLKSADKAIIVQQIHYWLQIKRKAKDTRSFNSSGYLSEPFSDILRIWLLKA